MKKIISMLLVLAMLLAMVPMVLAETYFDQFTAIVTANTTVELGEKEDVYCQVWGVDYEDDDFLSLTIDWYTTDRNVIKMPTSYLTQADGQITIEAVGVGTAKVCAEVTATFLDGRKYVDYDYVEITVTDTEHGVEVSPWTKSITVGDSFDLTVKGVGFGGKATFWSDNTSVATVDNYGRVTGKGAGTTNIWAEWNGRSDYCSVNVKGKSNVITALTPTTQSRSVSIGTSQSDLKKSFDTIYGYYTDSKGQSKYVACPVSWSSYNYNANSAGVYTFYGTVSAPAGYQMSPYMDTTVTATVTVVKGYTLTASVGSSKLKVGDKTTLTVRLTDANGKGVNTINGSNVQIAFNYAYGCITLDKYYTAPDKNGYAYVTVTGQYIGTETLTAVAWCGGQEFCGTGLYLDVAAKTSKLPFVDVPASAWYYEDLLNVVNMGIINGKTPNQYKPDDNMTYAEAIKIAAVMNQYYYNGEISLKNGTKNWYDTYVEYAKNNGIPCAYTNLNAKITRSDYVHIFYNALPASCYTKLNSVSAVPDMKVGAANYDEVLTFYNAGVLTGSDAYGNFNPNSFIKRSEVVTIIARMMDNSARKSFKLGN